MPKESLVAQAQYVWVSARTANWPQTALPPFDPGSASWPAMNVVGCAFCRKSAGFPTWPVPPRTAR